MVFHYSWGIAGLWLGPTVAVSFNFIFFYVIIIKSDWSIIVEDAKARRLQR